MSDERCGGPLGALFTLIVTASALSVLALYRIVESVKQ